MLLSALMDGNEAPPARRRAVTLQDVADRAGVSRSAASFALTNRGRVAEATRERVRAAARELGYRPNRTARNLRTQRSGVVGLCLPPDATSHGYYMDVTFGAVDAATDLGLLVAVVPGNRDLGTEMHEFDGLVVFDPVADDRQLAAAHEAGVPVVTGERPLTPSPAVRGIVHGDHLRTFPRLLDHLAEQGAKHPALIAPIASTDWASSSRAAYEEWCARNGVTPRIRDTRFPSLGDEVHRAALEFAVDPEIDAIVSMTDGSVLEVLTAAHEVGRVPGEDLLVACAADSPVFTVTDPTVTSLDLRPREFGAQCLALLHEVITSPPDAVIERHGPVDLVVRGSTVRKLGPHPRQ